MGRVSNHAIWLSLAGAKSPRPVQAGRGSLINATNTLYADCYGYCYAVRLRHCAETELNALRRAGRCQSRANFGADDQWRLGDASDEQTQLIRARAGSGGRTRPHRAVKCLLYARAGPAKAAAPVRAA